MKEKSTSEGLLCFGGSFNPIHEAHLTLCRIIAHERGFDAVMLVPSARPPHKGGHNDIVIATDRLRMCQLAIEGDSQFAVSDIELRREGPSYTYDTVLKLKAEGHERITWLIGADMLLILPKWYRAKELIREADILVMRRPGYEIDWSLLPAEFRHLESNVVEAPLLDVSATEIRRRLREGEPTAGLLAPAVEVYIRERGLYGASPR